MPRRGREGEVQTDRQRIREADPIGKLIHLMEGKGLMLKDAAGAPRSMKYATLEQIITIANTLLRKTVPDLKTVDIKANDGEGVTFTFLSKVPLPHNPQADAIEHMKTVATDLAEQIQEAVIVDEDEVEDDGR